MLKLFLWYFALCHRYICTKKQCINTQSSKESFTASFYKASPLQKLALWRLLRKKPNKSQVKFKFKRATKALKSAIIKWRLEKESVLITPYWYRSVSLLTKSDIPIVSMSDFANSDTDWYQYVITRTNKT